jgi:hypothetical protein
MTIDMVAQLRRGERLAFRARFEKTSHFHRSAPPRRGKKTAFRRDNGR